MTGILETGLFGDICEKIIVGTETEPKNASIIDIRIQTHQKKSRTPHHAESRTSAICLCRLCPGSRLILQLYILKRIGCLESLYAFTPDFMFSSGDGSCIVEGDNRTQYLSVS